MKTLRVIEAPVMQTPHGVKACKLYDTVDAQVIHLTLEPGEALIRHITPVDVFFYVLEGTGIIEVGDEKMEVSKDTLVESPKDILHCWSNESESTLRVLVVKAPRPTSATKLV